MNIEVYNRVAGIYSGQRSPSIGLTEILKIVRRIGGELSILDLGCGTGFPIAVGIFDRSSYYMGVDSSGKMVDEFKKNVPGADCALGSMSSLSYPDDKFDLAFSFGSIFHLTPKEQKKLFTAVAKSVRIGGILVFTTGESEGYGTGKVCGEVIEHWSLGKSNYIQVLGNLGYDFKSDYTGEGDNYFMEFERSAN
ncbi:class I SAM-dependent DNA methyltransferase [Myxosarcina sp. GI1(2024)]